MAKIYETKEDFQRDVLKEQAHRLRHQAHSQDRASWLMMAGGMVASLWNVTKRRSSAFLSFASTFLYISAVVELVRAWRTESKAHDADLERERLGPGQVALPPDVSLHDVRLGRAARTPLEHAARPEQSGPAAER